MALVVYLIQGCHITQHNDTQHCGIQLNDTEQDNTQHSNKNATLSIATLSIMVLKTLMQCVVYDECLKPTYYAECRYVQFSYAERRGTDTVTLILN
jgi:hypothetical protein